MKSSRLALRKRLIEEMSNLAMLELMLEQAKDDYREAASEHNEILMLFHIQQYALDIKKKKYDIQHVKKLLEEN